MWQTNKIKSHLTCWIYTSIQSRHHLTCIHALDFPNLFKLAHSLKKNVYKIYFWDFITQSVSFLIIDVIRWMNKSLFLSLSIPISAKRLSFFKINFLCNLAILWPFYCCLLYQTHINIDFSIIEICFLYKRRKYEKTSSLKMNCTSRHVINCKCRAYSVHIYR